MPYIIQLKGERLRMKYEMLSLTGTALTAAGSYPELYRQHEEVHKNLTRVKKTLRDEGKKRRKREEYYDTTPVIEVDKQINQLLNDQNKDPSDEEGEDKNRNPPIPQYGFPERPGLRKRSTG